MTDIDLLGLPLDRFCNRVLAFARERMRESDWQTFQFRLGIPPEGVEPTSGPWSEAELTATWQRNA